ncbi:MAG: type I-G CRISPR-associated protein Cas8g2 [Vicinamibacterales bacterium]
MAEASIPVDLFSPGQVFASLGFLEAADVLLGDAEGRFDWTDESPARFCLRAAGNENPFAVVLKFLAEARVRRCAPVGYADPDRRQAGSSIDDHGDDLRHAVAPGDLRYSDSFPDREGSRMALPIELESSHGLVIPLGHWADGSNRNAFKLYAGNRSAYSIACAMLRGTFEKSTKKRPAGEARTRGVVALWEQQQMDLIARPFDVLTPIGGSFNFDPRGGWTALDAGYSPDEHHAIAASPVVEILAAWGLEHARPDEYRTRKVRYGVWSARLPPMLARPALAGVSVAGPVRVFQFALNLSGKNKVVTSAQEETNA